MRIWFSPPHSDGYPSPPPSLTSGLPFYLSLLSLLQQKPIEKSCDEDYPGPKAKSEKETNNIINFFRQHAPIVGAIDWHSYGQLILRPWGFNNNTSPDDAWMKKLSTQMATIIEQVQYVIEYAIRGDVILECHILQSRP